MTIDTSVGGATLSVSAPGFETVTRNITVAADEPSTVMVALNPVTEGALTIVDFAVADVSVEEEHIILENTGDHPVELGGWTLRDREDDGQVARGLQPFVFPADFSLDPGERVTVWTSDGSATDTDFYWGYGIHMWNSEGDIIILETAGGERALEYPYGTEIP